MTLSPVFVFLAFSADAALDDAELARRIREGDEEAFRMFFERHHGLLFRYLRRRGVPEAVCEDLLQHAFLTIWERRATIDPSQSLRAFLFRIGHNRALNHFRDTAKFVEDDPPESVAPATPEARAAHAQIAQALHRAVEALPPRRRAVFELCFMQQLTYREAAEALGISIKTVENQMGHALRAARSALAVFREENE